jgi:hypothetical protein
MYTWLMLSVLAILGFTATPVNHKYYLLRRNASLAGPFDTPPLSTRAIPMKQWDLEDSTVYYVP